jgi:membrane protease YdiL (CAAX protease family)
MNKLTGWIKCHQIIPFFILAFAITWGLGFSYEAVYKGQYLLAPLVFVATCGPALAGVIISAVCNTQPKQGKRRAFWIAFFVALVVSALVFTAHTTFINRAPLSPMLIVFTLVSVIPVAFVISQAFSRIPAVKSYLSSLVRIRGVWDWALLALILIPGLILLSIAISRLLHLPPPSGLQLPESGLTLIGLITIKFLYQFFFFNATGEEAGWRGFALPRLQARTSPLVAALILALFWAPWHFFLWQAEGKPVLTWQYWLEQYVILLPATFIIVWLYNRSQGSILVAGIAHAAANTAFAIMPNSDWRALTIINFITALVLILVDHMWKKLPSDHPAVYQMPESYKKDVEKTTDKKEEIS